MEVQAPLELAPADDPMLQVRFLGIDFPNPIGAAAGYDKDGKSVQRLLDAGFGHVEVGTVTPVAQPGNPKPHFFKMREDLAVINRCGFNSLGADAVAANLEEYVTSDKSGHRGGVLAVNIGKNKLTEDAASDYVIGVHKLSKFAAFLVVNVSSPNTPGLRALQAKEHLEPLLQRVLDALHEEEATQQRKIPLLVKIAPDLETQDKKDIAEVVLKLKLDGVVVTNTTISRPDTLQNAFKTEVGGLSGLPLRDFSTRVIHEMYELLGGKVPLIGIGGVSTGRDAYDKIKAGATLIQVLTVVVFDGDEAIPRINKELAELLKADGYTSLEQAVGAAHKK